MSGASIALKDRLRYAVSAHATAVRPPPHPSAAAPPPIAQILRGDWHETAHGPVFVRDEWFPLDHHHGAFPLGCALDATAASLACLLNGGAAPAPARLAFFDIETTGLSSGTGTYMVLAGLGSYETAAPGEPAAFRMRQYFLADLAHERAMLAMLADDLARFDGLVTYNGRAFDMPFVQSRLTLSRLRYPCDGLPHFDLLHIVRRLYKHRMPGCKLAEAERRLLRIDRPDDVPGSLIPSIYFDYLRAGRVSPLRAVFRHNAEDVLSLVGVLAQTAALFSRVDLDPEDAVAVARWWELVGEPGRAAALYRSSLRWLEGGEDWGWAAMRLARLCRRSGEREEAAALWQYLWAQCDRASGVELAKHLEHHARDLGAAAEVTRALLVRAEDAQRIRLVHRLARLERKLQR
ncbi:MAG: ribonuclease H-like domain-containing protein [Chloroflexota bacterium]|nr:ribonuclease H-like domain-containing protein [Chloroflexota bacterium]